MIERYVYINIPNVVSEMTIPLDGVNVITGYRGMGKTYILKSIYATLLTFESINYELDGFSIARSLVKDLLGVDQYEFALLDSNLEDIFRISDEDVYVKKGVLGCYGNAFVSSVKVLDYLKILNSGPYCYAPLYDIELASKLEMRDWHLISDGHRLSRLINMLKEDVFDNRYFVMLLDNPDNCLHTKDYESTLNDIYNAETVFLTSHNPTFINLSTIYDKLTRYYYCRKNDNGLIELVETTAYESSRVLNEVIVEDSGVY